MTPVDLIDPRIRAHLAPDERVLWQGAPRPDTFFSPAQTAPAIFLAFGGFALGLGLLDGFIPMLATVTGAAKVVPALAAVAAGGLNLWSNWQRRGALWSYAITDRRILSVLGHKLIRSVPAGAFAPEDVKVDGTIVFWGEMPWDKDMQHSVPEWMRRGPDRPKIGFYGQSDPQAVRQRILDWLSGMTDAAVASGQAYLAKDDVPAADAVATASVADGMAERGSHVHRESGISVDLPEGWDVSAWTKNDGPLKVFGITLLPRFIRETERKPYSVGASWNALLASGAPNAGFALTIQPGPLTLTLDAVRNDPWSAAANLELLDTVPNEERPGGYRGFSIRRLVKGGGSLMDFGTVMGDVELHQIWLSNGTYRIEATALSPHGNATLAAVGDSIAASLRG